MLFKMSSAWTSTVSYRLTTRVLTTSRSLRSLRYCDRGVRTLYLQQQQQQRTMCTSINTDISKQSIFTVRPENAEEAALQKYAVKQFDMNKFQTSLSEIQDQHGFISRVDLLDLYKPFIRELIRTRRYQFAAEAVKSLSSTLSFVPARLVTSYVRLLGRQLDQDGSKNITAVSELAMLLVNLIITSPVAAVDVGKNTVSTPTEVVTETWNMLLRACAVGSLTQPLAHLYDEMKKRGVTFNEQDSLTVVAHWLSLADSSRAESAYKHFRDQGSIFSNQSLNYINELAYGGYNPNLLDRLEVDIRDQIFISLDNTKINEILLSWMQRRAIWNDQDGFKRLWDEILSRKIPVTSDHLRCHLQLEAAALKPNPRHMQAMIDYFSKEFNVQPMRNIRPVILKGFSRAGDYENGIAYFNAEMQRDSKNEYLDSSTYALVVSYVHLLKRAGMDKEADQMVQWLMERNVKFGTSARRHVYEFDQRRPDMADDTVRRLEALKPGEIDVTMINRFMRVQAKAGSVRTTWKIVDLMMSRRVFPNQDTLDIIISVCLRGQAPEKWDVSRLQLILDKFQRDFCLLPRIKWSGKLSLAFPDQKFSANDSALNNSPISDGDEDKKVSKQRIHDELRYLVDRIDPRKLNASTDTDSSLNDIANNAFNLYDEAVKIGVVDTYIGLKVLFALSRVRPKEALPFFDKFRSAHSGVLELSPIITGPVKDLAFAFSRLGDAAGFLTMLERQEMQTLFLSLDLAARGTLFTRIHRYFILGIDTAPMQNLDRHIAAMQVHYALTNANSRYGTVPEKDILHMLMMFASLTDQVDNGLSILRDHFRYYGTPSSSTFSYLVRCLGRVSGGEGAIEEALQFIMALNVEPNESTYRMLFNSYLPQGGDWKRTKAIELANYQIEKGMKLRPYQVKIINNFVKRSRDSRNQEINSEGFIIAFEKFKERLHRNPTVVSDNRKP